MRLFNILILLMTLVIIMMIRTMSASGLSGCDVEMHLGSGGCAVEMRVFNILVLWIVLLMMLVIIMMMMIM